MKNLKPIKDIKPVGTYYITKDFENQAHPFIPSNAAVTLYLTQDDGYGIISYKDGMHVIRLEYLSKTPMD